MNVPESQIKAYMKLAAISHLDEQTGEVCATTLAEDAAHNFDLYEGDDISERLFELSAEVAADYEAKFQTREAALT